ncbi:coth-domain-containing protein [Neocallimastix lanati (nom. inval.)]|jgi:hypothetical protein|nr:coth-domain-containing protein [Neocallimastix sp. JGI-2020a]
MKALFVLVLTIFSCLASGKTSFFDGVKRSKLFELLDNEIGEMYVHLPENDYNDLVAAANVADTVGETFTNDLVMQLLTSEEPRYELLTQAYKNKIVTEYKTKNATMEFKINGETSSFSKVTFSLGGSNSRSYKKIGYNLKIRGKQNLYDSVQFRIRAVINEPTMLRAKLTSDIFTRMGIKTINTGYIKLYINDIYYGLYTIQDSIKVNWIEREYNDTGSTGLIFCKAPNQFLTLETGFDECTNVNEDFTDNTEWVELLKSLDASQTPEEMNNYIDTKGFIKSMAAEWLNGSWDRFNHAGHNYYMYKNQEIGKWIYIPYDFDNELGNNLSGGAFYSKKLLGLSYTWPNVTFEDYIYPHHITEVLILNDDTTFVETVKELIQNIYNPVVLFDHIDEVKKLIDEAVRIDKTPAEDGSLPGRVHVDGDEGGDYRTYQANSEFTTVTIGINTFLGIKRWILDKFRFACDLYDIDCSFAAEYLEGGFFTYEVDEELENPGISFSSLLEAGISTIVPPPTQAESTETVAPTTNVVAEPTQPAPTTNVVDEPNEAVTTDVVDEQSEAETVTVDDDDVSVEAEDSMESDSECWSEVFGHPCCQKLDEVYEVDDNGSWGYEDGHWCGIIEV